MKWNMIINGENFRQDLFCNKSEDSSDGKVKKVDSFDGNDRSENT